MPDVYGRNLTREDLEKRVGSPEQVAGITEFSYESGRGRAVRALRVDTGVLSVDVVADRALDVAFAHVHGVPFVWRSANDIAGPAFYEAASDEWLRSFFGGWLTTCGLSNFGPPGKDRWGTFGQHGRINNIPAAQVCFRTHWGDDRCTFEVSGTMHETKALGEKLVLRRVWSAQLGGSTLRLVDRVTNEGSASSPHMMLYHCNAGFPLLDRATRVYVSHSAMEPRDEQAARGRDVWDRGGDPDPQFAEQVFIHTPRACDDRRARALVANGDLLEGLGFEVAFDPKQLPALITWRMLGCGDYVMAVEPANTPAIQGREYAAAHGLLPMIEPGESRVYELELCALTGDALRASIATIQSANAAAAHQR